MQEDQASIQFTLGKVVSALETLVVQVGETRSLVQGNYEHFSRLDKEKDDVLAAISKRVDGLAGQVEAMAPAIARWSKWQQIGVGVILTISGLIGLFSAGFKMALDYLPSIVQK